MPSKPVPNTAKEPNAPVRVLANPTSPTPGEPQAPLRRILEGYGLQVSLAAPANGGLRLAAGNGGTAFGLHATLRLPKGLRLRPRLDAVAFSEKTGSLATPIMDQSLSTRVSNLSLGADLLAPLGERWSLGLAAAEMRWTVSSANTVSPASGGSMSLTSRSHWNRPGLGPVLTFRASERMEWEARMLNSHYGYQKQPAAIATVGFLWHF